MKFGDFLRARGVKIPVFVPRPELLLCPNTPKPLHQVVPREIYGGPWWNKTRKEAYASTGFLCAACGVHKVHAKFRQWLEGHELYEIDYAKGRMTYVETVPLCHCCHNYIHDGRLKALLERGEIRHSKYVAIIQYGDDVLANAGLVKPPPYDGPFAEWSKWRLVLDGVEYPPKFKTYEDWLAHFSEEDDG